MHQRVNLIKSCFVIYLYLITYCIHAFFCIVSYLMLVSGYQTDLFKYFFCLTNNQYSLCFSLSSRARTASGFLSSWACGSSSSPSSCSVMSSLVWFPKPCGSAMMPGTSSSWFFSPFPTDTWPASACALDPSKDCSPTNHKPIGAGGRNISCLS